MKLLFDENLSPELVRLLADLFPESVHVRDVGLKAADDPLVWQYAEDNLLIIVSKDSDLHQRSFMFGHPPKLVLGSIGQLLNSGRGKAVAPEFRCNHHFLRRQ